MINDKKKKIFRTGGIILSSLFILLVAFSAGAYSVQKNYSFRNLTAKEISILAQAGDTATSTNLVPSDFDFNLYWTVWDTLKQNYVDKSKIDDKTFFYGSLKGLVNSVGDPYTTFFDPKDNQKFHQDLSGVFDGIGAEISLKNDIITIISPLDGMPASKAGLHALDQIYAINGSSTAGMSVEAAVSLIRGPKGTPVKLSIYRSGINGTKDYNITRDTITVKSVKTEYRKDGVYVVKVSEFGDDTLDLFNNAVTDILKKKPKGLIIDLRNNPGGYLDTAVAMGSEWVANGPIVFEQMSDGSKSQYSSTGSNRLGNIKTVVLVNGGSASASEILAGALRDYKKATLVGEKTFGKGSVQSLISLADGSAIKVTIAKWLTPNGDSINGVGITPSENIKLTDSDYTKKLDPQLDRALEILGVKKVNKKAVTKK